jgi:hypothetical protein
MNGDECVRETYDIDVHATKARAFGNIHVIVPANAAGGGPNINGFASVGHRVEWCICRIVVFAIIARGIFALEFFVTGFLWVSTTICRGSWCPRELDAGS